MLTMFSTSFWAPNTPRKIAILGVIGLMVVLHFTELTPVYDSTYLVFGWLPLQLAYDIAYHLVGVGIIYVLYRMSPGEDELREASESPRTDDKSVDTAEVN